MTTYEVVLDNAKMQVHCNDEAPPGPTVVDIPAIIRSSDMGYSGGDHVLFDSNTGTYTPCVGWGKSGTPNLYFHVQYGEGPNLFNYELPDGSTLVSIEYVTLAYREADVLFGIPAPTGWDPTPTKNPWVGMASSTRTEKLAFPEMVVTTSWVDALDELIVSDPTPELVLSNDSPMNLFGSINWSDTESATCQVAYLAARVTYTT